MEVSLKPYTFQIYLPYTFEIIFYSKFLLNEIYIFKVIRPSYDTFAKTKLSYWLKNILNVEKALNIVSSLGIFNKLRKAFKTFFIIYIFIY